MRRKIRKERTDGRKKRKMFPKPRGKHFNQKRKL